MQKNYSLLFALFAVVLLTIACSSGLSRMEQPETFDDTKLQGIAEDLWGNKIDLKTYRKGLTLIQPFSPANCGYCLFDGEFIEESYFKNNKKFRGFNFYQCLFNPQLDIYSYIKHYHDEATPALTFPPTLHLYHRNGFPFIIAFRNGKCIYSKWLSPYEETFRSLSATFWVMTL